jgi:hypothetical protein
MNRILAGIGVCVLLLWIVPPAIAACADDNDEVRATGGGGSWNWTPEIGTGATLYKDIRDYSDRPGEEVLKSLVVEWQNPQLDGLGNFCTVRGQMKAPHAGRKEATPVTWFQGVTAYIATTPGDRPDWSKGTSQADTLHDTAVTSPSGKLRVRFDLRKTKYDRNHGQSFQIGLALARHTVKGKTSQLVPAKPTASGRVTRRALSDTACFSHPGQGFRGRSHDSGSAWDSSSREKPLPIAE